MANMSVAQAKALLGAAGLVVSVKVDHALAPTAESGVRSQTPLAKTIVAVGSTVTVTVPVGATQASILKPARGGGSFVVVIDPGHQSTVDSASEPIGPGSMLCGPCATAGAVGVATGIPEYEMDRQLAAELQDRLAAAGVKVILTRTTDDVELSGSQRAAAANTAKADLLVQIHAQSSRDESQTGVTTLFPAVNRWTRRTAGSSRQAASLIQRSAVRESLAADNGTVCSSDVVEFNWSNVPSVLVEAGSLSNPVEDRLLSSSRYQGVLAQGIADGIIEYLKGRR